MADPDPSVRQISGNGPDGKPVLSVLARRTYAADDRGALQPLPGPAPLVAEPVIDEAELLVADLDLYPWKRHSDVIVLGHAYGREREGSFAAAIAAGAQRATLRIHGARRAARGADGRIRFSDPAEAGKVPLSLAMAYGGRDAVTERALGNPYEADRREDFDPDLASPYRYPRNPWGRGFVVGASDAVIEAALLPQIEDPADLLTPERLVAERPARWTAMPLPTGCGWLPYAAFLRMACLRILPNGEVPPGGLPESRRGWLPAEVHVHGVPDREDALRLAQGAWPQLRAGPLQAGDTVTLERLHPRCPTWSFRVPKAPSLAVDGRKPGRLVAAPAVVHTLIVEPDAGRVTVVWRGSAPALRPYTAEELATMPFRAEF